MRRKQIKPEEVDRVVKSLERDATVNSFTDLPEADRKPRLLEEWRSMSKKEFNGRFMSAVKRCDTTEAVMIMAFRRVFGMDPRTLHEEKTRQIAI